MNFATAASP